MLMELTLTVSESKRLIAKGVAAHPAVRKALASGTVAVATGSTNAYVYEELTGTRIEKHKYMTGATLPAGRPWEGLLSRDIPDLVLRNGQPIAGVSTTDAIKDMKAGDVFIKGANALHYESRKAGVLIGHRTGGTVGAVLGAIVARRIMLLVPVGLEKCVAQPLERAARLIASDPDAEGFVPSLWPLDGEILTEIEAVKLLSGAECVHSASGGLAGAEGAVRLVARGTADQISELKRLVQSVHGEPPFVRRA